MLTPDTASDVNEPSEPARLRDAVLRTCLGFVKLGAVFLPEIVLALIGGVVGLIVGIMLGVGLTAELFSGPGAWARAGPIALLFPVLTALGPPVVGLWMGLVLPTVAVLLPHSLAMAFVASKHWRDRYVVLFLTTAFVWLPVLLALTRSLDGALGAAVVIAPFTAPFGFVIGALFVAVRGVLDGRSLRVWWREADGSMVLAMAVLTTYTWLITVFAGVLFCFLPTVPFAVALTVACAIRLLNARRHPALSLVCLALGLLWSALAALLLMMVLAGPPRSEHEGSTTTSGLGDMTRVQGPPQLPPSTTG